MAVIIIIIIIYPLTARVVRAPQIISQPLSSIFPCSPLPSGTRRTPGRSILDVVFPPLPLSALSSFPFHCALQNHYRHHHHHHHHQSLNRQGRWGTTDDFATTFLHFPLFSTALWDLANSRPVHSLMLSSHLFFCLPRLLPLFTVSCKMVSARTI